MEMNPDRPVVGQKIRLKGGHMDFVVSRIDDAAQTVDLEPTERGFSVARNVRFNHIEKLPSPPVQIKRARKAHSGRGGC
jgi:hypothetical protein